ncbi:MAG: tRNA preQ1(34) S-adenosylmethionine ribosyltransferase-isomerase QueA [Myxococcales bacterium]|nr:tRNA preQ1(34) S-adenosylmethionine ribosyltransferase-isomerase QueA [Myxococcales bacterium]
MRLDELDFDLPPELIAQAPLPERDGARLLVLDRGADRVTHHAIRDLPSLVEPSLFVFNDTRVFPARLLGHKDSGGRVELLLVERLGPPAQTPPFVERWVGLGRASKPLRSGVVISFADGALAARVLVPRDGGELEVELSADEPIDAAVERVGAVPLPPYIRRAPDPSDRERYQTVYASEPGAVAAPTAGLHFTRALLAALDAAGHRRAHVTLHVGPGTFRPVKTDELDAHAMHAERYDVSEGAAAATNQARAEGRPVLAVGTTVVRTLESAVDPSGEVRAGSGSTRLFLRPPATLRVVDSLLTNFHLPRSTLIALVMAVAGVEPTRRAYAEAVRERYRFFSYGDAMLIRAATSDRSRPGRRR